MPRQKNSAMRNNRSALKMRTALSRRPKRTMPRSPTCDAAMTCTGGSGMDVMKSIQLCFQYHFLDSASRCSKKKLAIKMAQQITSIIQNIHNVPTEKWGSISTTGFV